MMRFFHVRLSANFRRGAFTREGLTGACPSMNAFMQSWDSRAPEVQRAYHNATIDDCEMYR
jgi:hypothetical protein